MDDYMASISVAQGTAALNAGEVDRAVHLLSPVARQGHAVAMFNLAVAYMRLGELESSIWWYKAASNEGDVDATAYLGFIYKRLGDSWEAENWFREAAGRGSEGARALLDGLRADAASPSALVVMETQWAMGRGHALNGFMREAKECWMMAAELGHVESMYHLGLAAEDERNAGLAVLWHTSAARHGSEAARNRLDRLVTR